MRGRSIYFTADELAAMEKFFDDFDIYFSAEKHKEMYEYLLHNRMWLILRLTSLSCVLINIMAQNIFFL